MGKTQGLDPISQHVPHTSTHTFKMEFLTPYHSSREVPAPAMPTVWMPPSPAASRKKNPIYTESRAAAMARQTAPLLGGCAPSPTLLPEPPGEQGAILPRLLQSFPGAGMIDRV